MSSPFPVLLQNATLTFTVKSTTNSRDPVTGNPIQNVTPVELIAFLKEDRRPGNQNIVGVDTQEYLVYGYLISPQWFPEDLSVKSGATCECVWQNSLYGTLSGKLTLRPIITPTTLVNQVLGDKFRGSLVVNR